MDFTPKVPRVNPFGKANFLSKALFCWIVPLLMQGKRKELELDDLYDPVRDDMANQLGNDVER